MIAGCRGGDEERENRNGKEGEEREKVQEGEGAGGDARTVRRSNTCGEMREREKEKGMMRNMERRRQGDG
jgi:hypothetical protein